MKLYLFSLLILVSCSNANFSGSSRSGTPSSQNPSTGGNVPNAGGNPTNPMNPNNPMNPTNPNAPNTPGAYVPPSVGTPGFPNPPAGSNPNNPYNPNNPNNPSAFPPGFNPPNVIGGPPVIINNPGEVIFGPNPYVFHIGDGNFSASSCQADLRAVNLSGTKFFFEFRVQTRTPVSIRINYACGIDNFKTNYITLGNSSIGNRVQDLLTPSNYSSLPGFQNVDLEPGYYAIVIDSLPNDGREPGRAIGDRDDFNVGNVVITGATNSIQGIRAGTL